MQLQSAHLYYGTRRYPISSMENFQTLPTGTLDDVTLSRLCHHVARATGCLSAEAVRARITHHLALDEQRIDVPGRDEPIIIPATTQVLGNGFSIIWSH